MNDNLELELINKIMMFGTILKERGFDIKLKFWNVEPIEITLLDIKSLKNSLYYAFYNVFEILLRDGVAFNRYDLEAFSSMFGITVEKFVEFLNGFIDISCRVMNKNNKERSLEEKLDVKMVSLDLDNYRKRMLNYLVISLMEMTQKLHDGVVDEEILQKYDSLFIIESLTYGGRWIKKVDKRGVINLLVFFNYIKISNNNFIVICYIIFGI